MERPKRRLWRPQAGSVPPRRAGADPLSRRLFPLAGPALVATGLAALALAGPSGGAGACDGYPPRDLAGEAVELTAGDGFWSAWLSYPAVADDTITVLWRAETGASAFRLGGSDARGGRPAVLFGPSPVLPQLRGGGLPWPRIGREWGTRLRFPHAGCWTIAVSVGERRGALRLWVRPAIAGDAA